MPLPFVSRRREKTRRNGLETRVRCLVRAIRRANRAGANARPRETRGKGGTTGMERNAKKECIGMGNMTEHDIS